METSNVTSLSPFLAEYPLFLKVALQLRNRVWPVIWCFGLVGNLFSAIIFSRKSFKKSTSALFFRFLACTEFLYQFLILTPVILDYSFDVESLERWHISCKMWNFLDRVLRYSSAWILVMISMERLVCVWKPHKVKIIFSRKKAIIATTLVYAVMCAMNYPSLHLKKSEYQAIIDAYICRTRLMTAGWKYYVEFVAGWIELLVYSLLPLIVMFFTNGIIIILLVIAARRRQENASSGRTQNLSGMTATLLIVCFTYFCLSLPICVDSLIRLPPSLLATSLMFYVETCKYANHAFNFFLYCCSGARFRQELADVFRCCKGSKDSSHHQPSSQTPIATISKSDVILSPTVSK